MTQRYPPIADYALLADCHSAALVSRQLSIDWACLRRFDHASSFARLLDWERGGCFSLTPVDLRSSERRYVGDTLVLETTVTTGTGRARVLDCFAMRRGGQHRPAHQLLRVVKGIDGTVTIDVLIQPRFDYGELRPWLRAHPSGSYTAVGGDAALVITSPCELEVDDSERDELRGRLTVAAGDEVAFSVQAQVPHLLSPHPVEQKHLLLRVADTIQWWERWSQVMRVEGPYAAHVRRSAVVLKGLTCAPTGAIVAAPTTSLPEEIGGERNWDYRYSWIRDSALVVEAMSVVGHAEVAAGFRDFVMRSAAGNARDLQIMYGPYGNRHLPEIALDLEGYRGSRPVRVGNAAASQRQHDMYGHILDVAHTWRETHDELDPAEWHFLRQLVDEAARVWKEPDHGIWEVRGEPQHFTASKVMCWVALDRGITIAEDIGDDTVDLDAWRTSRDEIRAAVERHGVHPEYGCFVQAFGSRAVDAALLQLPIVGFVPARDERMVATVRVIRRELSEHNGFIHRYRTDRTEDGLPGGEATFLLCSFWLVDVLSMQGRYDEAVELFERLLGVANDLGLYAEEYDPVHDALLGNFPQAFTHMALINSAHHLASARERLETAEPGVQRTADRVPDGGRRQRGSEPPPPPAV